MVAVDFYQRLNNLDETVFVRFDFSPSGDTHDDEVLEVKWFPFNELPTDLVFSVRDIIEKFVQEQSG